jgi:hypothetical protein
MLSLAAPRQGYPSPPHAPSRWRRAPMRYGLAQTHGGGTSAEPPREPPLVRPTAPPHPPLPAGGPRVRRAVEGSTGPRGGLAAPPNACRRPRRAKAQDSLSAASPGHAPGPRPVRRHSGTHPAPQAMRPCPVRSEPAPDRRARPCPRAPAPARPRIAPTPCQTCPYTVSESNLR